MITVETSLGTIKVAKSVIGNMIKDVVDSFNGKVIISNSKGKIVNQLAYKLGPKEEFSEIEIELNDGKLDINMYIVLKLGSSIKTVTGKLIEDIRTSIKDAVDLEVNELTVTVTGMMSKKIAPRHIEVKG